MNCDHDVAVRPRDVRILIRGQFQADLFGEHRGGAAPVPIECIVVHGDDLEMLGPAQQVLQFVDHDAQGSGGRVCRSCLGLRLDGVSHKHLQKGGLRSYREILVRVAEDFFENTDDARGKKLGTRHALEHVGVEIRRQLGEKLYPTRRG